jgi:hypothetical protein
MRLTMMRQKKHCLKPRVQHQKNRPLLDEDVVVVVVVVASLDDHHQNCAIVDCVAVG